MLSSSVDWWSSLSRSTMVRHVKAWTQALSLILSVQPTPRDSGVKNVMLVLLNMYNVSKFQTKLNPTQLSYGWFLFPTSLSPY